jgi:hypothetical protein
MTGQFDGPAESARFADPKLKAPMSRLRPLLVLLLLLPLAGCFSDQEKQLVTCQSDAAAATPKPTAGQAFDRVRACMDKAGYRFIGWDDGVVCGLAPLMRGQLGDGGIATLCFEPKSWLARRLYRLEVPEKNQTAPSE